MRKLLRRFWNTWRMPKNGEHIDIVEKGKVVANVRCYRVEKMDKWDFSIPMVEFRKGWHKLTRDGVVGQPQHGITWKFPDGV